MKWLWGAIAAAGVLGGMAAITRRRQRQAERAHPPPGRFLHIDSVRLHYVEHGHGPPMVLLHGNNSMVQDFAASGLLEQASKHHRVIAFDRPGSGYSSRPHGRIWTPQAQAQLLHKALRRLGVARPIVVGVSWGALVAIALALDHPRDVRGLVLVSGYLYPAFRFDVLRFAPLAIPGLGTALAHVVAPLLGRWVWPRMARTVFAPQPVAPNFASFPVGLVLRPSQLRTAAAEGILTLPAAWVLSRRYGDLEVPLAVVAGAQDRMTDPARQSKRLCREWPGISCRLLPGVGHMTHYLPQQVLAAVEEVERTAGRTADQQNRASTLGRGGAT